MSPAPNSSSRTFHHLSRLSLAVLLTCALGAKAADFYRWTDDKGITHYSDKPPKGVNAEKVRAKRSPTIGTEETQASNPDAERCKAERDRLALLRSNRRIQMEGRDGQLRDLTQKEIEEEIAFSMRAVERFCGPNP
jgi:hypothetical protein